MTTRIRFFSRPALELAFLALLLGFGVIACTLIVHGYTSGDSATLRHHTLHLMRDGALAFPLALIAAAAGLWLAQRARRTRNVVGRALIVSVAFTILLALTIAPYRRMDAAWPIGGTNVHHDHAASPAANAEQAAYEAAFGKADNAGFTIGDVDPNAAPESNGVAPPQISVETTVHGAPAAASGSGAAHDAHTTAQIDFSGSQPADQPNAGAADAPAALESGSLGATIRRVVRDALIGEVAALALALLGLTVIDSARRNARTHPSQRAAGMRTARVALPWLAIAVGAAWLLMAGLPTSSALRETTACERTITANVVSLDQIIYYNRLGSRDPWGMIYALRRDVVDKTSGKTEAEGAILTPGNVELRPDKRPRPLTLRMNVGDCLQIKFQNLLATTRIHADQPVSRDAGIHVIGMQLVNSIADDGSNVGRNSSSLVAPGDSHTYTIYGEREGANLLYSEVDTSSVELIGTPAHGLFGAVNIEPRGSEWYRSQVTHDDMVLATSGTASDGHPKINYDATYKSGRYAGTPILNMLQDNEIVHADLTAVITGPNKGPFGVGNSPPYRVNAAYPNRNQPFREFTIIFHDEVEGIQAFPEFWNPGLAFMLDGVRDSKGINYGIAGIGPEIVANRIGVGPEAACVECKYEEFFLSSWAIGDPAIIVDVPADTTDAANQNDLENPGNINGNIIPGPKATKALYPDDPSNVYHSYINDHTKFRNLSAGKEHHMFHLHSHQWLQTPDDDNSTYLDSQGIGPGASYTYEIAFGGSGNRNKTMGDAIFHCHFYPHFAQGMWALWRSHDTFEDGTKTELDPDGLPAPAPGSRALPDAEISRGTPSPAIVPLPTQAEAPLPEAKAEIDHGQVKITGAGNPGFPFNIPGVAGHRAPTPPLDIANDGGLPRHIITGGSATSTETRLDFGKELNTVSAKFLDERGTPVERAAMDYHALRWHPSVKPDGSPANFETNGLPPQPGAPYSDPCRTDGAKPTGTPRIYKAAAIQFDMKLNKEGWHFPQSRMLSLEDDVAAFLAGTKPPEPYVMRVNTNDCITYYETNLLPNVYQQDAYQIKTPTDVIGQHIHLVKFDVTSADGSGNGYNYEDGTFSPDEVRERIRALRAQNRCHGAESGDPRDGSQDCPTPKADARFGVLGARTTIQRWYADPLLNNAGKERQLGTVFTHDHFGPSTHQQVGLYATLIVEPNGSQWRDPETGQLLGTRQSRDGGPTSWRADILTASPADSFREFYFEFADFQHAYLPGRGIDAQGKPIPDPLGAINPPGRTEAELPFLFAYPKACPESGQAFVLNGCPEAISKSDIGTFSVNYRNEPVGLRVHDPNTNAQAVGTAGDLSYAFSSWVKRADPALNVQPGFYPPLTKGVMPTDPFTPLLRTYANDKVKIRIQVGATEEGHNASVHGMKWLQEVASPNSGWRNSQMVGISEQFTLESPLTPVLGQKGNVADRLYMMDSSVDGIWNGLWGMIRTYGSTQTDLLQLPNNVVGTLGIQVANIGQFNGPCPKAAPVRSIDVTAVEAADALPGGTLVYNSRWASGGPLHDPTAILYVRSSDLDAGGKLKPGVPIEPLILRAAAGDCIKLTLSNRLPAQPRDLDGYNSLPFIVDGFNANHVHPSASVGLHPQLLSYDVTRSDGANVGTNPFQALASGDPAAAKQYLWYAGDVKLVKGMFVATPVEYGATNLSSSDPIKHSDKGAVGGLIIEPQGSTWTEDPASRASATVRKADGTTFRDFVMIFQDDLNLRLGQNAACYTLGPCAPGDGNPVPTVAGVEDSEDSGTKALNYRTEPLWYRMGIPPFADAHEIASFNFKNALSNILVGGDPQTPVFTAAAGMPVRIRVLEPGGHPRNHVVSVHGHTWERNPYIKGSTQIGNNPLSEWRGAQEGHGPSDHWDIVLQNGAGGKFKVKGDYLIRDMLPGGFYGGLWGILRVQ
jgi:hypothetical protein